MRKLISFVRPGFPAVLLVLALVGASMACGTTQPPPPAAPAGKKVDPATTGSIAGKVTFTGKRPPREPLRMGSDQTCVQGAGPHPLSDAVLIAGDGSLQNSFVYIKDGLDPAYTFDPATSTVTLDQKTCRYMPRVLGLRVGQSLEIINSDPTLHNVHAIPVMNREFNQGLISQGSRMTHTFTTPEVMIRFKCNVHNWMTAWVGVLPHPYFAVTGPDGSFVLKGVPPGTYTIEAWHEVFGRQTATVTVATGQAANASFVFRPVDSH